MHISLYFLLISSMTLLMLAHSSFIKDFFDPRLSYGPHFPESMLYDVTQRIGFSNIRGHIGAFGDFNSDQFTDLFVISENFTVVTVYFWNHRKYAFESGPSLTVPNITNIAASDFSYDGKLDLLVSSTTYPNISKRSSFPSTLHQIFLGDNHSFEPAIQVGIGKPHTQVLVMDANADLKPDLFGTSLNGTAIYWINNGNGTSFKEENAFGVELDDAYSNGFVDMNGDCLADLFVATETKDSNQFELWINNLNSFVRNSTYPMPEGAGQITFADFDGDGNIDVMFPVCNPDCYSGSSLHFIYNIQKPLCESVFDQHCRPAGQLCTADNYFKLGDFSASENSQDVVIVGDEVFKTSHLFRNPKYPMTVRTGDYNMDGYVDLVISLVDDSSQRVYAQVWQSIPCKEELCGLEATEAKRRTFSPLDDAQGKAMTSISNVYAATFYDLDENGVLDIFLLADSSLNGTVPGKLSIHGIYNNIYNDAYFLKTLGLNGVCTSWCPTAPKFPDPKPYGVNLPGANFKFTVTEITGHNRVSSGMQLSQSSHLALQTPYILFGLGRTNNYIEQLYYGITIKNSKEKYFASQVCIIPNGQIVAIPWKPDDPKSWEFELYVSPSGITLWVFVAMVGALLLLGLLIFFFSRREKAQDEKEKRETAHLFSFDAL